jgi:CheY-like chemotaxis protein
LLAVKNQSIWALLFKNYRAKMLSSSIGPAWSTISELGTDCGKHPQEEVMQERIFVVDDDRDTADTLARLIGLFGYEALAIGSGQEAIDHAASSPPEMALIDIEMPDMDGYETARRIRCLPDASHVILVAVTGWTRPEDKRHAYDCGFDLHIAKPLDLATLMDVLALLDPSQRSRPVVA